MEECGLIGLIKFTYPVSFIAIIGGAFGGLLSYLPSAIAIRSLKEQLGIRKIKEQK